MILFLKAFFLISQPTMRCEWTQFVHLFQGTDGEAVLKNGCWGGGGEFDPSH